MKDKDDIFIKTVKAYLNDTISEDFVNSVYDEFPEFFYRVIENIRTNCYKDSKKVLSDIEGLAEKHIRENYPDKNINECYDIEEISFLVNDSLESWLADQMKDYINHIIYKTERQ